MNKVSFLKYSSLKPFNTICKRIIYKKFQTFSLCYTKSDSVFPDQICRSPNNSQKFPARFLQMSHGLLFPVLTEKGKIGDTAVTEQYIFNMFMCVIFSFLFPSGSRQVGISSFSVSCSTIQHDNQKIYFGNELVH